MRRRCARCTWAESGAGDDGRKRSFLNPGGRGAGRRDALVGDSELPGAAVSGAAASKSATSSKSKLGFVEIRRRRGRIAGYSAPRIPVKVLWAGTNRPRKKFGKRADGWSFPPAVRELLLQFCKGRTVLHLFGGKADFGFRIDVDPATKPDLIADAWLPPFAQGSFDVVILDPPYFSIRHEEKRDLLNAAAWCAREHVIWFHNIWIAADRTLRLERGWLVRCGDQCAARVIQVFRRTPAKVLPVGRFSRGPALKYNRWLTGGPQQFSLELESAGGQIPVRSRQSGHRQIAPMSPGGILITAGEQR